MNPERVQMLSELAGARRNVARLREEAAGLIVVIRMNLSPYGEDAVLRADTAKAVEHVKRLHELKTDLVKHLKQVKELEEALGEHE